MIVSVIGTAGRDFSKPMTAALYTKMVLATEVEIERVISLRSETWADVTLRSGGAAWSDHILVDLANKHPDCRVDLHFPAEWDYTDSCFSRQTRDGQTANYYHGFFSKALGRNTLAELEILMASVRATVTTYNGFKVRNVPVSKCDLMVALTWGIGNTLADGGTSHTWGMCKAVLKKHIPLATL